MGMAIDLGVILVADSNNDIRFYIRQPTRLPRVTRRPPLHQNSKELTDISLWVSILGLFGSLIYIISLGFMSTIPPASQGSPAVMQIFKGNNRYKVVGVNFGVVWAAYIDNAIRFYVCQHACRLRITRCQPSTKFQKN